MVQNELESYADDSAKFLSFQLFNLLLTKRKSIIVILNATYVEQKQKGAENKIGQLTYEFYREDYYECLHMFEIDIAKELAPGIVARIIS